MFLKGKPYFPWGDTHKLPGGHTTSAASRKALFINDSVLLAFVVQGQIQSY